MSAAKRGRKIRMRHRQINRLFRLIALRMQLIEPHFWLSQPYPPDAPFPHNPPVLLDGDERS